MKARDNASSIYTELTDEERDKILQVIQRDFTLRENEKKRLKEIEKGVTSEEQNKKLLVEKKNFSENFCPLCCSAFGYIFNRRQICLLCKNSICKSCSQYSYFYSRYICLTCIKKNELRSMSFEWFYSKVGRRFRSFGSAKVVRVLYKKKTVLKRHVSDGELDHVPVSSPDPNSIPPFNQLRNGDLENPELYPSTNSPSLVRTDLTKQGSYQHLPQCSSQENLSKSNLSKAKSLDSLASSTPSLQRHHSPWNLPLRDISKVHDLNLSNHSSKHTPKHGTKILHTKDIYKEAFENTRKIEEKKFRVKFDTLLKNMQHALETQSQQEQANMSFGDIMVNYRSLIRELLFDLSQRLQMAVENYLEEEDNFASSQKVKQIVSRLVEDHLGESVDLTSDEAVSDLSSLSDDSFEGHHSYEDQLAQVVVSKVIENQRLKDLTFQGGALDRNSVTPSYPLSPSYILPHDKKTDTPSSPLSSDTPGTPIAEIVPMNAEVNKPTYSMRKPLSPKFVEEHVMAYEPPLKKTVMKRKPEAVADSGQMKLGNSFQELTSRPLNKQLNLDDVVLDTQEIDPDYLSLNLTPIEETADEEEDEGDGEDSLRSRNFGNQNWILRKLDSKSSMVDTPNNHCMLVPQPQQHVLPQIGDRVAEDLSDNSDIEEDFHHIGPRVNNIFEGKPSLLKTPVYSPTQIHPPSPPLSPPLPSSPPLSPPLPSSPPLSPPNPHPPPSLPQTAASPNNDSPQPETSRTKDEVVKNTSKVENQTKLVEKSIPSECGDPKFVIPPESITTVEGEAFTVTCRVEGTEPIDVFWFQVGEEVVKLEDGEKYEIKEDEYKRHVLTVYHASKPTDAGQYMCIAVNDKGKCSQYFIININKNPQPMKSPEFLKTFDDLEVTRGSVARFRCKVKGYPPPRISWYKDGKLLSQSSDNPRLEKCGNRDYSLSIDHATLDDDAEYCAVARNIVGEVRHSVQLIVESVESPTKDLLTNQDLKMTSVPQTNSAIPKTPLEAHNGRVGHSPSEGTTGEREEKNIESLSRKLTETKDDVSNVAEDMLQSADELTLIEHHLDYMDQTLNKLEYNLPQHDSPKFSEEEDSMNNNKEFTVNEVFAQKVLAEYHIQDTKDHADDNDDGTEEKKKEKDVNVKKDGEDKEEEEEEEEKSKESTEAAGFEHTFVDDMFSHQVLSEHRDQKMAAENMRKVTSTALGILEKAELAVQEQKDLENNIVSDSLNTDDGDEPTLCYPINELSIVTESKEKLEHTDHLNIEVEAKPEPDPDTTAEPPNHEDEDQHTANIPDSPVGFSSSNSPNTSSSTITSSRHSNSSSPKEPTPTSMPQVTHYNFGLKPIDAERYKKDFYVNPPNKTNPNKYSCPDVVTHRDIVKSKQEVEDTEDKIYMAACDVYSLEDKIQQLEVEVGGIHEGMSDSSMSALEDEVARAMAGVVHSENQVASIEKTIEELKNTLDQQPGALSAQGQGQTTAADINRKSHEKNQQQRMVGESQEQDIPACQSEVSIDLPSVSKLRALFNQSQRNTPPYSAVKRTSKLDPGIHSITARSLSKINKGSTVMYDDFLTSNNGISLDGRSAHRIRPSIKTTPAPRPPSNNINYIRSPKTSPAPMPPQRTPPLPKEPSPEIPPSQQESPEMGEECLFKGGKAAKASFWEDVIKKSSAPEAESQPSFSDLEGEEDA